MSLTLTRRGFLGGVLTAGVGATILTPRALALPRPLKPSEPLFPKTRKTPLPGGYMGKILRVNLTTGKITTENLPEAPILRKWVGGKGLGQLILQRELPQGVSPLSPDNPLIFMTGPMVGTGLTPGSTKYFVVTLNNETGFTVGMARASGHWGPYLKFAGYDGIIVNGASSKPVYLWVHDGRAEIRDAAKIWGKDTHETEDLVKRDVGQPGASVLAIGPAGENLVSFALIENDYNHTAAHSGVGAIMGSKKLKAIGVFGAKAVPVRDEPKVTQAGNSWRSKLNPYTAKQRYTMGTAETFGAVSKNWTTTIIPDMSKDLNTQEITPKPCYGCMRNCPHDAKITKGPHAGYVASMGPGGENLEGAALVFGIGGTPVRYLTDIYDRIGVEASAMGSSMALAIECYQKGLLTKADTDGLELKWEDPELIEKLSWKVARREGWLARSIGLGAKRLGELIGGDAPKFAVHVKGAAPRMHEWRPFTARMLGLILNAGNGTFGSGFDMRSASADLGYPQPTKRDTPKGKAEEIFIATKQRFFLESSGVCYFGLAESRKGQHQDMVDALAGITGWNDLTLEEILTVGERTLQVERLFNIQHGLTPEDDYANVGQRFLDPVPDGPYKGWTIAPYLKGLVFDFYRLTGWDEKTGAPYHDTLRRLGIDPGSKFIL